MKRAVGYALFVDAFVIGPVAHRRGRFLLSVLGIAFGVALGLAVHLINASAVNEFGLATQRLSGEADLIVRGPRAGFDEELYPKLARLPEVAVASPAIELNVKLYGRDGSMKLLAIDPLRAIQLQPALVAAPGLERYALLESDTVLLSTAAAEALGLEKDSVFELQVGLAPAAFKVIGRLPEGSYGEPLAIIDIATAQWRLDMLGRLNRLDLRLRPGVDVAQFQRSLGDLLPPGVAAVPPQVEIERSENLSRAYRVNLNVLALVALFTGAFLVFTTQALALLERRSQLALLRVLGKTRSALITQLGCEGGLAGALGAVLGIGLGYVAADFALARLGGDLGGGYFEGLRPKLHADSQALGLFFLLGVAAAILGALIPAWEAATAPPAQALKAGSQEQAISRVPRRWPGIILVLLGVAATQAPPIAGLPLFGYAAIALILTGAVLLVPQLVRFSMERLPAPSQPTAQIALSQLKGSPGMTAVSLATLVVSFTLMVAMAIMVTSFRNSLEEWLFKILPADLYVRSASSGESAYFSETDQAVLGALPGVEEAHFHRFRKLLLDPAKPPITLIARPIDPARAERVLPLVDWAEQPDPELPPVWISEAMADLYGFRVGAVIELPIAERRARFFVAGIWRDYARQTGAVIIPREMYIALTGDRLANDAALTLTHSVLPQTVIGGIRKTLASSGEIEIARPAEIRKESLRIFDRTFALTYALEASAVLVGLFGVSAAFGARAIARRSQFAMLRHLGMQEREIAAMVAIEGLVESVLGALFGLALGFGVSLILIHVVNRQSFHWSMELDPPWLLLSVLAVLLVAASTLTAYWSGRAALGKELLRAVREDW